MAVKKSAQKKKAARAKVNRRAEEPEPEVVQAAPPKQPTDFTPESLGREAKALLENETFVLALNYVESRALSECRVATNAEEAFRGTLKSQAVQDIRATLHAYIAQGEAEADRASKARESVKQSSEEDQMFRSYQMAAAAAREEADGQYTNGRQ
jgi:hypothetical protein